MDNSSIALKSMPPRVREEPGETVMQVLGNLALLDVNLFAIFLQLLCLSCYLSCIRNKNRTTHEATICLGLQWSLGYSDFLNPARRHRRVLAQTPKCLPFSVRWNQSESTHPGVGIR